MYHWLLVIKRTTYFMILVDVTHPVYSETWHFKGFASSSHRRLALCSWVTIQLSLLKELQGKVSTKTQSFIYPNLHSHIPPPLPFFIDIKNKNLIAISRNNHQLSKPFKFNLVYQLYNLWLDSLLLVGLVKKKTGKKKD